MDSFFPVFAYHVQTLTTEPVRIGILRSLADADLSDNGLCIATYRNDETQSIKDQGFEGQFRLRIDFVYTIAIISNISEAKCNEQATILLATLEPGIDIHVTYNNVNYSIYLDSINDKIEFNPDLNVWIETLAFTGHTYQKEI